MPTYLLQFSYTNKALAELVRNPEDRSAIFERYVKSVGGRVVAWYHCRGDYDGLTIFEVPDELTATSVDLAVSAPGHLKETRITPLYTVEEGLRAMDKARGQGALPRPGRATERDLTYSPFGA